MLPAFLSATRAPTISTMSAFAIRSSMNGCGIRPAMGGDYPTRRRDGKWSLFGCEHRTDARAERAHVDAARGPLLDDGHDFAEVLRARSFGRLDRFGDQRVELAVVERLRQVGLQHRELGFFLRNEVLPAAFAELGQSIAALLDHALDDGLDAGVVERTAGVDLALFHAGERHAHDAQARLIAGLEGGLHVLRESVLERHGRSNRVNRRALVEEG